MFLFFGRTHRQEVTPGQYWFGTAYVKVEYVNKVYTLVLEPIGNDGSKKQDSTKGIVQDFVWHVSGPTPLGKEKGLDVNNATHWYGMCVAFSAELFRDDTKARPPAIPVDSLLQFTFTPNGEMIDGSKPVKPVVFERKYTGGATDTYAANDLVPGPYTVTATVVYPDRTKKKLLLQGPGDHPNYKPSLEISARPEGSSYFKTPCDFIVE